MTKTIVRVRNYDTRQEEEIEAATEDLMFEHVYLLNNSLRYCNGQWVEFKDASDQSKYKAWIHSLSEARHFALYYGSGIVD